MGRLLHVRRSLIVLLLCAGAAACAGAPVQEMSNARQAINAAREAGAGEVAPESLNAAQALLERAESSLRRRAFREARRDALAARNKASEALDAVRLQRNNGAS